MKSSNPSLPLGWATSTLDEVAGEFVEQNGPPDTTSFTYVDIASVDNHTKQIVNARVLPVSEAPSRARQNLRTGDVVVSMTRPNLNAVARVPDQLDGAIASTGFHVLRSNCVNPGWLLLAVQTREFIDSMAATVQGVLYPAVRPKDVREWRLPIPPLREQQRITEVMDELLSDLEASVSTLRRVQTKLSLYRASVLKAAVEGDLTAEWRATNPHVEPADKLLARILVARRRRWEQEQLRKFEETGRTPSRNWKDRYREPYRPDVNALPSLPDGWCWASIEQISTKVVDGVHKKPDYRPAGIPFVTVRNLTAGPGISFERLKYISEADHSEFIKRADPARGDILISKDGTLGVVRVVDTDVVFSIFVSVALVKPVDKDMSKYLSVALSSPQVQAQMVPKGSGLVHIHLEDLRQDCIPLPPASEQALITEMTDDQLSIIDHIESEVSAKLSAARAFRQAILRHAFDGKIVPQDPNDEPASELLRRIAVEREERGRSAAEAKRAGQRPRAKPRKPGRQASADLRGTMRT
ncbi:MAG TPA: restriction endonuclease subunit S [Vicinamibacterales bacterium]|nr:restriction endonuclease subunit S [Vicinamibacterales bacterium]